MRGWIRNIMLLLLFTSASFQYNEIEWNDSEKLTWNDFNGKITSKGYTALTATAISFSYMYTETSIELEVRTVFDKDESWVNEDLASNQLLAHEQLHFDITELVSRKFRKSLAESEELTPSVMNEMYGEYVNEVMYLQHQYDKESNHSVKRDEQLKWELKVQNQLNEYDEFKDAFITRTRPSVAAN